MYWSRLYRTQVRVTIAPERGVPAMLVDEAVSAKRNAGREQRKGLGAAWDDIWCVFDHDDHPGLAEAIARAEANGIRLAVSNPCIELWFILHVRDQTGYIERNRAQSLARRELGCEKGLSDSVLNVLGGEYNKARDRATALEVKHAGDGSSLRSNPSSELWRLIDRIQHAR